jgi:hypothetical protein
MEDTYRLKIKIGPHEFEAEGSALVVQEQFQIFKEMVASTPAYSPTYPSTTREVAHSTPISPARQQPVEENAENSLHKIMQNDDDENVVSLTIRPDSVEDAVLLILLGQKWMLGNDTVTGGAIMDGLTATGGLSVTRVDRLLEKVGREGSVIVIGERRSKRYRLTNAGINKAKEIAEKHIFLVP